MTVAVERLDDWRWRIPKTGKMRTEGLVFASNELMRMLQHEAALEQVRQVAMLPGIVGPSMAMPDIHWGYGFPIGGVAAFSAEDGVISPGGVGYDINCGVRLLRSALTAEDIAPVLTALADRLYQQVPCGVGSQQPDLKLSPRMFEHILEQGARWAVHNGYGRESDLEHCEDGGLFAGADVAAVSARAVERGCSQLGTLGSGNHFVEVQRVDQIADEQVAAALGLFKGQITVSIHTGSRGFGHQVCDDFLKVMARASRHYGIELPDRQLCCAPLHSPEAAHYLAAMACAANFAFANRQLINHTVRRVFEQVLGQGPEALKMALVYDVCHNVARWEDHVVAGGLQRLCVHRKGATRAYPPGHAETPLAYRHVGQPVLIPGDMGRYSYVLVGTAAGYAETYGSVCHGAGRLLSRHAAKKRARSHNVEAELAAKNIIVRAASRATVAEEMPEAYKDVREVVQVVEQAGIGKIVARLRPLVVVKG